MKEIRSHVIRIYRRKTAALAGLVEHVQSSRSASFQSLAELGELLSGRKPFRRSLRRADPFPVDPARPRE